MNTTLCCSVSRFTPGRHQQPQLGLFHPIWPPHLCERWGAFPRIIIYYLFSEVKYFQWHPPGWWLELLVAEISNQCTPYPCYREGSERCMDGRATFTCVCKPGWKGVRCEDGEYLESDLRLLSVAVWNAETFFCVMCWQTSMSVQILNFQRDVIKSVTTSPGVSTACVKMATSAITKSTAWVRLHCLHVKV